MTANKWARSENRSPKTTGEGKPEIPSLPPVSSPPCAVTTVKIRAKASVFVLRSVLAVVAGMFYAYSSSWRARSRAASSRC